MQHLIIHIIHNVHASYVTRSTLVTLLDLEPTSASVAAMIAIFLSCTQTMQFLLIKPCGQLGRHWFKVQQSISTRVEHVTYDACTL